MRQKCRYLAKNAILGPNFAVFGPKFLIMMGGSKSFDTHIMDNLLGALFASFFGRPWDQMGQKCQYLAQKANFGPNLAVWGPKILVFMGVSKSFGSHITLNPPGQLVRIVFWSGMGSNGPKMLIFSQKCQFWPNLDVFGPKSIFWGRWCKTFGILISGYQWHTFSVLKTLTGAALIGR